MKKTLVFIIPLLTLLFATISCSKEAQKIDFVKLCFDENPTRAGLPLSQLELLYEGVTKADDASARQSLQDNCPKAAANFLK